MLRLNYSVRFDPDVSPVDHAAFRFEADVSGLGPIVRRDMRDLNAIEVGPNLVPFRNDLDGIPFASWLANSLAQLVVVGVGGMPIQLDNRHFKTGFVLDLHRSRPNLVLGDEQQVPRIPVVVHIALHTGIRCVSILQAEREVRSELLQRIGIAMRSAGSVEHRILNLESRSWNSLSISFRTRGAIVADHKTPPREVCSIEETLVTLI